MGRTIEIPTMDKLRQRSLNPKYDQPVTNGLVNPFNLTEEEGYIWLKGNLHCHTTNSDGRVSPQERVDGYAARGYDFACLTDHQKITPIQDLNRPGDMILFPGAELHPDNPFGGLIHHIVALNLAEDIPAAQMPPQHVINAVRAQGASPWLAHPHWSSVMVARDVLPLKSLAGLEVVNGTAMDCGRSESAVHWDDWMWLTGELKPALGVDDAHGNFSPGEDSCRAWTMVRVKERTTQAVIQALEAGASYATTGPEITHVSVRPLRRFREGWVHEVEVKCSPAVRVTGVCDIYGGHFFLGGEVFTEARFELPPLARWVRVEVHDRTGAKAWANPIPLPGGAD